MAGLLVAVFDSVFMFNGTWPRFVIVFLISTVTASGLFYLWMLELKHAGTRREKARLRLESMSERQVWMLAIGLLVLGAIWVVRKLSWLAL